MIKKLLLAFFLLGLALDFSFAEDFSPFKGRINAQDINIRSSSTVNSETICKQNKGAEVFVVSEAYEWYRIQLPKNAAVFVHKDFLAQAPLNQVPLPQSVKVLKDNVNIRISPDKNGAIIGKVSQNQTVTVVSVRGDWVQILPLADTYGWINKKFVDKIPEPEKKRK